MPGETGCCCIAFRTSLHSNLGNILFLQNIHKQAIPLNGKNRVHYHSKPRLMKGTIRQLIADGKTSRAIQELQQLTAGLKDQDLHDEAILQAARYEAYAREKRLGTSSPQEQSLALAQINHALLQIAERLPDSARRRGFFAPRKWWEWVVAASIIVGILAGLAAIFDVNFNTLFGKTSTAANTVTVLAHGPGGKDDKVLPSRGIVKLIYGDAIAREQINDKGEATFKQISDAFFAKDARVEILFEDPEGEPYRALRNDSLYRLERGKYVALEVKLYGLESLKGVVKDFKTGEAIEGAKVRVQGEEAISNAYGEFALELPPDKQEKFQTIRAYHPDYQDYEVAQVPTQTQKEIPVLMKPKN
jgi:hypothetical protein